MLGPQTLHTLLVRTLSKTKAQKGNITSKRRIEPTARYIMNIRIRLSQKDNTLIQCTNIIKARKGVQGQKILKKKKVKTLFTASHQFFFSFFFQCYELISLS